MSTFETFNRKMVGAAAPPQVTVLRSGMLSLNRSAHNALGEPDAVELLYSRDDRVIGLRAVESSADTAHFIREQARGRGPFVITAIAFIKHYDLSLDHSLRWNAYVEHDVLCIRLTDPSTEVTSNRAHAAPTIAPTIAPAVVPLRAARA